MADMKAWIILMVLISFHGNSDSQTDMMTVTMFTEITGTAPPTFRTPPPPPPPSIPPPPPSTSTEPPPTPTPEPPVTTRIPPPPPPSPPPPPPSSVIPPSPTPTLPAPTSRMSTRMMTTTVAEPTEPILKTTRPPTEPAIVEPDPIAESLGLIGVLLTVAVEDFDQQQFKNIMAQEVNIFCTEYVGQCAGEGQIVSARDVVIITAELYEQNQVNGAKRRLLQGPQTLVEYYVQDPSLSTNVMLTTEQQRVFLANEAVKTSLETNIDGYNGIAPVYAEPVPEELEGWEIALIVICSVAAVGLVVGAVGLHMFKRKAKGKQLDLELQEKKTAPLILEQTGNDYATIETNGLEKAKMKLPVDETDVSTQVQYKDILTETGFEPVKGETTSDSKQTRSDKDDKPDGGTSMIVTAEISSSSSGSSTSSENGESELDATAQKQQEIPPSYEPPPPSTPTEVAEVMSEFDNLVSSQSDGLAVNSSAFKNPGFEEDTEESTGL